MLIFDMSLYKKTYVNLWSPLLSIAFIIIIII